MVYRPPGWPVHDALAVLALDCAQSIRAVGARCDQALARVGRPDDVPKLHPRWDSYSVSASLIQPGFSLVAKSAANPCCAASPSWNEASISGLMWPRKHASTKPCISRLSACWVLLEASRGRTTSRHAGSAGREALSTSIRPRLSEALRAPSVPITSTYPYSAKDGVTRLTHHCPRTPLANFNQQLAKSSVSTFVISPVLLSGRCRGRLKQNPVADSIFPRR